MYEKFINTIMRRDFVKDVAAGTAAAVAGADGFVSKARCRALDLVSSPRCAAGTAFQPED
jgi:hypothetical protein